MWQHVFPINDARPHLLEWSPAGGQPCQCRYRVDWSHQIVIHESWDCREAVHEAVKLITPADPQPLSLATRRWELGPFRLVIERAVAYNSWLVAFHVGRLGLSSLILWTRKRHG